MAAVIRHRPHPAPFRAGDDNIADTQRAALHQERTHHAAAAIDAGFDDHPVGVAIRVGGQFEDFRLQDDRFFKLVEVGFLHRGNFDRENFAAHFFGDDFVLQQLLADSVRVGVRAVDLVDGDDHGHVCGARMVDRLDRLRHDAVIGGDDQNDNVGDLGAARAHLRKRGMARRVDEGNACVVRKLHLIGADMLGDPAGFAGGDIGRPQRIQERRLAVIDMAHDGHHRWAGHQAASVIRFAFQADFHVRCAHPLHLVAELMHHQFGGIALDTLGHRRGDAQLHELFHYLDAPHRHAVGKFLDGDGLRHHHLAHHRSGFFAAAGFRRHAALALALAFQRRQAAAAFVLAIALQRPRDGKFAAAPATGIAVALAG